MNRLSTYFRLSFIACLCIAGATTARAELTTTKADDSSLTVFHLTVTPAAEPQPAFKHHLVIPDIDTNPGNAVPYYYRAMLAADQHIEAQRKKFGEDFDDWCTTGTGVPPLEKLPLDKLREADLPGDGLILEQLRIASARRDCDWQLGLDEIQGFKLLVTFSLEEFQKSRSLSRLLALRTRLAVAERRYDDAIDALRMNYRLGVNTGRERLLVCGLIGIAEAGVANGTLVELIAAPDSPNMYWALAELPHPLVDMRAAARFELGFGQRMFPLLRDAETADHSPAEWNRLYTQAVRDLIQLGNEHGSSFVANDVGAGFAATGVALAGYPFAKARLIEQGMDRARIEQMSVGQVMAIYSARVYQRFADEFEKLWYMPYSEAQTRVTEVEDALREARMLGTNDDREVLPVVATLTPAMQKVCAAQVRLQRDIAALQIIEALRMYAAANNGRLPASLDAVTQVPIPLNPATGKPFTYHLDGQTAVLELHQSDGFPGYNHRYEIRIADTKK